LLTLYINRRRQGAKLFYLNSLLNDILVKLRVCMPIIIVTFLAASRLFSQGDEFRSISNVKARPLAMGGAFTAVVDDIAAIAFNPASFGLYSQKKKFRLTFFLNPVTPFFLASKGQELRTGDGDIVDDALLALGLAIKSVSLSLSSLEFGLLLSEEHIDFNREFTGKAFSFSGLRQNHTHSLISRLKLAETVSLGVSAGLIYSSKTAYPLQRNKDLAVSYGVLLEPENGLKIGVSYVDMPDSLRFTRAPLERFVDESINAGISYSIGGARVAVDVRNLGEETKIAVREFHLGLEQVLFSHFALRTGWFQRRAGEHVYSFGLGLFDLNSMMGYSRRFKHRNFAFNYAVIVDHEQMLFERWHLFSLYLRL